MEGVHFSIMIFSLLIPCEIYSFSVPLVDKEQCIIGLCGGHKFTKQWVRAQNEAADAIDKAREKLDLCSQDKSHCQGNFVALSFGISHGNGRTKPGLSDVQGFANP